MNNREITLKVLGKIRKESSLAQNLKDFIKNKIKMKLPSKEEAKKILNKYVKNEKDLEKLYNKIPSILKMKFSFLDNVPKETFKAILILASLLSLLEGTFPAKSSDAYKMLKDKNTIETEKKSFEYVGEFIPKDLDKVIDKEDRYSLSKVKLRFDLMKDQKKYDYEGLNKIPYHIDLYKNKKGDKFKDNEELISWKEKIYIGKG